MAVDQRDATVLTGPFGTPICRVEDRAIGPDKPTFVLTDEEDPLVVIDHPVTFTFVAVRLLPPRFASVLCKENAVICADSPTTAFGNKPDTAEWKLTDVFIPFPRFPTVLCV